MTASLRVCASFLALAISACANSGDPPGGPGDTEPPIIVATSPDSGAVVTTMPSEGSIAFNEVISERTIGLPADIKGSLLLSPVSGEPRISWHREHISFRPREGFKPGRIYRVEVFPVLTDLRNNKLRAGRVIVFSTGPEIPTQRLAGTVVDWVAGRAAVHALIEAVLLPDSLVYRSLTDSNGVFSMGQMPPGSYLVYGVMDSNNDRRRGTREAYDTLRVTLDSTASLQLYAFAHDTIGPRIRQGEIPDTITIRLTFDRPLEPTVTFDTSNVLVARLDDSTTAIPFEAVYTPKQLDSLTSARRAHGDSLAAAKRDSVAAAADTTRPRPRPDTSRAVPRPDTSRVTPRLDTLRGVRPSAAQQMVAAAAAALRPGGRAPLDSTVADRMLARRPPPSDIRVIRVLAALQPGTQYLVKMTGARSLSGSVSDPRITIRAPRPDTVALARARRDSLRADSLARDSTRAASDSLRAPADTTRPTVPADTTRPRPRPDTIPRRPE